MRTTARNFVVSVSFSNQNQSDIESLLALAEDAAIPVRVHSDIKSPRSRTTVQLTGEPAYIFELLRNCDYESAHVSRP